jgi:hypothetical protein
MKKRILIIGGIVTSMLLLAGVAYVGGRLINGQGLPVGGPSVFLGDDGGQRVQINRDDIQPAQELPQTSADVWGLFDHRQNNSIFVGTGNVTVGVRTDRSGNVETSSEYDGPIVEVVVTSQTTVYEDVTMQQFNGPPPEGQAIQQVVNPGSLDGIGESSTIAVWGRKTDDRIIADILVYESPTFIEK